jgi:hypothetical protein
MTTAVSNAGFLQELEFRKGADLSIFIELYETEIGGGAYDMTGCEVRACVKARDGSLTVNFVVPSPPDTTGIVELQLTDVQTDSVPASPASKMAAPLYDWYVDIKLADGRIIPFCYGPAYCKEGGPSWA